MIAGNYGSAQGLGLDQYTAEGFRVGGGRNHHICKHVGGRHVIAMIYDSYDFTQTVIVDKVFQFLTVFGPALVAADQKAPDITSAQLGNGFDKHCLPLPTGQPTRQHDNWQAIFQTPITGQHRDPFRRDFGRIKSVQVNAPMDNADFICRHFVVFKQMATNEPGYSNHPFTPDHHRIVPPFQRIPCGIGSMKGGHKRDTRSFCRKIRAPSWRPGPGVNNVHSFGFDQIHQALNVGIQDQWIF